MNDKLRKKIVYACLALAVIWGFYNIDFNDESVPEEQTRAAGAVLKSNPVLETVTPEELAAKENLDWGQDPFRTKVYSRRAKPAGQWVVSGILYNKTSPLAYINAQPVRKGDTVDNARVIDIEKDYVTLEYGGSKQKIYVLEG